MEGNCKWNCIAHANGQRWRPSWSEPNARRPKLETPNAVGPRHRCRRHSPGSNLLGPPRWWSWNGNGTIWRRNLPLKFAHAGSRSRSWWDVTDFWEDVAKVSVSIGAKIEWLKTIELNDRPTLTLNYLLMIASGSEVGRTDGRWLACWHSTRSDSAGVAEKHD